MGTIPMQNKLAALKAAYSEAPMTVRLMAGAYIEPLIELLEDIVSRLNAQGGNDGN